MPGDAQAVGDSAPQADDGPTRDELLAEVKSWIEQGAIARAESVQRRLSGGAPGRAGASSQLGAPALRAGPR